MNWNFVEPLKSANLIDEFESLVGYEFPGDFKEFVMQYNGGRPEHKAYDTDTTEGRVFNKLLSFNKDDISTVWKTNGNIEGLPDKYVVFATDPFGNLICFDKDNDNVIFWNHEDESVEHIANTFTELLDKLYE